MNLRFIKDKELLTQIKSLVKKERQLLTQVLHHLREVERRKLFSELGYQSLFNYAVNELKYSEGQAGRRIQAMRLLKDIPQVEEKIKSGELSLTNISQAQSYFREAKKIQPTKVIRSSEKLKVLKSLENKSSREGQKVLLKLQPNAPLPKERERILTEAHTEVTFVMNEDLKNQLEEIRSLLGPNGASMSLAELISCMSSMSLESLRSKKFGKKRTSRQASKSKSKVTSAPELGNGKSSRYISKSIKHTVWNRDGKRCTSCGSQRNLNIDHIKPLALGGDSTPDNLRLLCFNCNQRQAVKTFGLEKMSRFRE